MTKSITISQGVLRIAGVAQIALGLAIWAGSATSLVSVHMTVGLLFVVSLWVLAVLTGRHGAGVALPVFAGVWGLVTVALGMSQEGIMRGDSHWIVQVLHLLVGLTGITIGEILVRKVPTAAAERDGLERSRP